MSIIIDGMVLCDGEKGGDAVGSGASGGGGGSGGSIALHSAQTLKNNGITRAVGGKGGKKGNEGRCPGICSDGGAGGVGRIYILAPMVEGKGTFTPDAYMLPSPCVTIYNR